MKVAVTTWSLEMTDSAELLPAPKPDLEVELMHARRPSPELGRFLYTAVGGNWYWIDRLPWTYEQWQAWQAKPGLETWVAYVEGTPAGYFELDLAVPGEIEIAYFGLLPAFVGQGLGGWLLSEALARAWALGPKRVWVHTCTLDGPHALANYKKRGMRVFHESVAEQELETEPPGPWPEASAPAMEGRRSAPDPAPS
ncbi:MAG: GNAT family N-acetyltransferase [Chloroflexota bacterium]